VRNPFSSTTTSAALNDTSDRRFRGGRILAMSAMLTVGLMAISTSTPALAVESSTEQAQKSLDSSIERTSQTVTIDASAVTPSIERDSYSVGKLAPAAGSEPAPAAEAAPAAEPAPVVEEPAPAPSWVLPVTGSISSPYGPRPNKPVAGVGAFHYGIDLAGPSGTPISSVAAGTVVAAGVLGTYGNWVLIDHGNGVQTGYAHGSTILVGVGQTVSAGETIALRGTTGASTGPHLHFEVRVNGEKIDPAPFMAERGVILGQ
jgi:murein DD-endopeptidase MepM/ murein hydrolase activator NlpD